MRLKLLIQKILYVVSTIPIINLLKIINFEDNKLINLAKEY